MGKRIYGIVLLIGLLYSTSSLGHDASKYTPQELDWLQSVIHPTKGSCCSEGDGDFVEEDIRDGDYWIQCPLDSHCPYKNWTKVPKESIITEPNKLGRPAVWWYPGPVGAALSIGAVPDSSTIRCYTPGSGL